MLFARNLNELRSLEEFADEGAVLLMDNFLNQATDAVLLLHRDARGQSMTLVPYCSNLSAAVSIIL
jgi:hypothetical protein